MSFRISVLLVLVCLLSTSMGQNLTQLSDETFDNVLQRVVYVRVTTYGGEKRDAHGVVLSKDGKILVPASALSDAKEVVVRLKKQGEVLSDGWLGIDPVTGLAVIKINVKNIFPIRFTTGPNWKIAPIGFLIGGLEIKPETTSPVLLQEKAPESIAPLGEDSFWMIQNSLIPSQLGAPVVDAGGALLGLVIRIEGKKGFAGVRTVKIPFTLFERWVDEPVKEFNRGLRVPDPIEDAALKKLPVWAKLESVGNYDPPARALAAENVLKADSKSPLAWWVAAEAYREAGQWDKALASYEQVTELRQEVWQAWYGLGQCLEKKGQWGQALDAYSHVVDGGASGSNTAMTYYRMAKCLQKLGQATQAKEMLERAVGAKKDLYVGWIELARLRLAAKNYEEAAAASLTVAQINPHSLEGWQGMAKCFRELKNVEGEIDARAEIARMKPNDPEALYDYALCLSKAGQADFASAFFERVVELNPKDAEAWYNIGVLREKQGDFGMALETYNKAIASREDFGLAWREVGTLYNNIKKYSLAVPALRKASALLPRDSKVWEELAVAEKNNGNKPGSDGALAQLRLLAPQRAEQLKKDFELFLR